MRLTQINLAVMLCVASFVVLACGCSNSTEPQGPEEGSVQAYLEANPEALEDEPEISEDEEFSAAEDE